MFIYQNWKGRIVPVSNFLCMIATQTNRGNRQYMVSMVKTQLYLDPRVGISGTWISGVQRGLLSLTQTIVGGPTLRRAYGNKSWSLDHHWIVFPVSKKLLQIFGHCHKWNPSISYIFLLAKEALNFHPNLQPSPASMTTRLASTNSGFQQSNPAISSSLISKEHTPPQYNITWRQSCDLQPMH